MERNANDTFGNQNSSDASSGAGFAGTTGQASQAGSQGTADASFSRDTSNEANLGDRARSALTDAGSTVRDRAGNLKNSLADALESGAASRVPAADRWRVRRRQAGAPEWSPTRATG